MYHNWPQQIKKSPYLNIRKVLKAILTMGTCMLIVVAFLASVILILTAAFVIFKVLGLIGLGWGWVFSPMWIPLLAVFIICDFILIGAYLVNSIIFIAVSVKKLYRKIISIFN